ncbi:pyridoxal-phosphate-dependent aminotransferase family protein [Aeromicrobium sp. CF3.5]|uniref:pyridoxal-phosphate-dependent aminotransferase family protein n=1 Tax=Aeromicrobium sp. CF3.5 TaxID=3373078 RepID=UPI003EE508E9
MTSAQIGVADQVDPLEYAHLMIPGPCRLDPRDSEVLAQPTRPHYGAGWVTAFRSVLTDLSVLLGAAHVYVMPGSGSSGLDATLLNLFEPGQTVVVADTGFFGQRLIEMARAHGLTVRVAAVEPGLPVDIARVEQLLPGCRGVIVPLVETATGVRHPVEKIADLARSHGALTVVDAVSAAGGERIDLTNTQVDAVVSASQKGLGAAPGLAVVGLGEHGHRAVLARSSRPHTWFYDLARWDEASLDDWEPTPVTMPTGLVLALASSLSRMREGGFDRWLAERAEVAQLCRDGLRALGFDVVEPQGHAASLVVVALSPRADEIREKLAGDGIMIAGGLTPFERDAFRVGLVGMDGTRQTVEMLLARIAEAIR